MKKLLALAAFLGWSCGAEVPDRPPHDTPISGVVSAGSVGNCVQEEVYPGYSTCLLDAPQTASEHSLEQALSSLPAEVNMRLFPAEVHSQGDCGWCVPHAVTAALERSYGTERVSEPHLWENGGGDVRDCTKGWHLLPAVEAAQALVASRIWTYVPNGELMAGARPTDEVVEREGRYTIDTFTAVGSVDAVKTALAAGKLVTYGFSVLRDAGWKFSDIGYGRIDVPSTEDILGYHAMLVVGYDADWLVVQNSWGEGWADQGYGLMSFAYLEQFGWGGIAVGSPDCDPALVARCAGEMVKKYDGCGRLMETVVCTPLESCVSDACVTNCSSSLTEVCVDGDAYAQDACGNLTLIDDCASDETCVDASCVVDCSFSVQNLCVEGNVIQEDYCSNREFLEACVPPDECAEGACVPCVPATVTPSCEGNMLVQTDNCGNVVNTPCAVDERCADTSCVTDCNYEIIRSCVGNDVMDEDYCRNQTLIQACLEDEVCLDAACEINCEAEVSEVCYEGNVHLQNACNEIVELVEMCLPDYECEEGSCVIDCDYMITQECDENRVVRRDHCGTITEIVEECGGFTACEEGACVSTLEGKIVYVSSRGGTSELKVMGADGTGQRVISSTSEKYFAPDWSPDGRLIAVSKGTTTGNKSLVLIDEETGGETVVTSGFNDMYPSWHPDGSKIIFGRDGDLYTVRPDGTGLEQITSGEPYEYAPDYARDGKVAFSVSGSLSPAGTPSAIYVMNEDGSGRRQVTDTPADIYDRIPSWSSEGSLAFESYNGGSTVIGIVQADGSNRQTFTTGDGSVPGWSPDSRHIAFSSSRDGNWELYVTDREGAALLRLTYDVNARDTDSDWKE